MIRLHYTILSHYSSGDKSFTHSGYYRDFDSPKEVAKFIKNAKKEIRKHRHDGKADKMRINDIIEFCCSPHSIMSSIMRKKT